MVSFINSKNNLKMRPKTKTPIRNPSKEKSKPKMLNNLNSPKHFLKKKPTKIRSIKK